jgi:hypothetical protein
MVSSRNCNFSSLVQPSLSLFLFLRPCRLAGGDGWDCHSRVEKGMVTIHGVSSLT